MRIFFLPISRHMVNLERLPDRPLPAGTTPQDVLQTVRAAMGSHDRAKIDEARAEMAALGNAMKPEISHDAAPPPAEQRDPRPLADALLGTWSSGMITVAFTNDGTFTMTMLGGHQRSGHWSVNREGKLVADLGGRDQAADAWIAEDQLTVSAEGTALTLKRASN